MIPQTVPELLVRAVWALGCLYLTFRVVTDGGIEEVCENERRKVSDKTIKQFRVIMYGSAYAMAVLAALLLSDILRRMWRAFAF